MIGVMYFNNDKTQSNTDKVKQALFQYIAKHGMPPEIILINPNMVDVVLPESIKVTVKAQRYVLPNHIWIGVDNGQ